jgi:porphobilinogen synthase
MNMTNHLHSVNPAFPAIRLRRSRLQPWLRDMVAEHRLHVSDLILPVFIHEGSNLRTPIPSMPGIERLSIDLLVNTAKRARDLGIPALALFPVIDAHLKSPYGDEAVFADNLVCRAIREVKAAVPGIGLIADVALDPYTSHGQDGVLENGHVVNDLTIEILCRQAVVQAQAGCDIVAPSDMMDGRIGAIRSALEENTLHDTVILAYSAKYASHQYGPFRDAVGSKAMLGAADKRTYQMDPANSNEALCEIALDVAEGADMVMVKPGLSYLDILCRAAREFPLPVLAYQVSGEYAMIKAAAERGWIDGAQVMMEQLLAFKRAGARAVLSYAALEAAELLG